MNRLLKNLTTAFLLVLLALGSASCLKDKVVDIVLSGETEDDFPINDDNENYAEPANVLLGQKIDDILADADRDRQDIIDAYLVGVDYGVIEFDETHDDWICSGSIEVSRTVAGVRQSATIVQYDDVSVLESLNGRFHADLEPEGVAIVNQALEDYINGANPTLTFTVIGGNVDPDPDASDPIVFTWRGWLMIQVVTEGKFEFVDI